MGLHTDVVPDGGPSKFVDEMLARVLSPLGAEAVRRKMSVASAPMHVALDPTRERFAVYIPKTKPPGGYGVMVFVPPWQNASLPAGWASALNRHGVIFVTPARAGNEEDILGRRMPAALMALDYVQRHHQIDSARTYIAGFSGGSRIAFRLAVAFPDVFRGAFLNAGSDPLGANLLSPPSPDRLTELQTARLVFVTGTSDEAAAAIDQATIASLRHWCVTSYVAADVPFGGHDVAGPAYVERALSEMEKKPPDKVEAQTKCRSAREADARGALAKAETVLAAAGDRDEARRLILQADRDYGGLIGPDLIALADRCACGVFDPPESSRRKDR